VAHWITLEMGKTSQDAMGDVWRGLEVVEASCRAGVEMLVSWMFGWMNGRVFCGCIGLHSLICWHFFLNSC